MSKQRAAEQFVNAFNQVEDSFDEAFTILAYLVLPDRRDVFGQFVYDLDKLNEMYQDLLKQGGDVLAGSRDYTEWLRIWSRMRDIRLALDQALDGDETALREALLAHMNPALQQRFAAMRQRAERRQREATRQAAAVLSSVIEETRRDSHIKEAVKETWDTERRIVAAIARIRTDESRKQIDAARIYYKRLTDRHNGHGKPLTDDERAEYFYLKTEKEKDRNDRAFGKQISEIVSKHGKPGTLTVTE